MDKNGSHVDPTTLDGIYDDLYSILVTIEDTEMVLKRAHRRVEALMDKLRD